MGVCLLAPHPIATVDVSAAAVRCTLLPCVLACVVMVYMTLMLCLWRPRLLSPVFVIRVLLLVSVVKAHRDRISPGPPSLYCIVDLLCVLYCRMAAHR